MRPTAEWSHRQARPITASWRNWRVVAEDGSTAPGLKFSVKDGVHSPGCAFLCAPSGPLVALRGCRTRSAHIRGRKHSTLGGRDTATIAALELRRGAGYVATPPPRGPTTMRRNALVRGRSHRLGAGRRRGGESQVKGGGLAERNRQNIETDPEREERRRVRRRRKLRLKAALLGRSRAGRPARPISPPTASAARWPSS